MPGTILATFLPKCPRGSEKEFFGGDRWFSEGRGGVVAVAAADSALEAEDRFLPAEDVGRRLPRLGLDEILLCLLLFGGLGEV